MSARRPLPGQTQRSTRKRGRPGISSLPAPVHRFDVSKTPNFEGAQDVEDARRAGMLRRQAKRDPANGKALRKLADRIDPEMTRHPETMASSRYTRKQRIRIISALWQVIYEA